MQQTQRYSDACQSALEILENLRKIKGENHHAACLAVFNLQNAQLVLRHGWKDAKPLDKDAVQVHMTACIDHFCRGLKVDLTEVLSDLQMIWQRFSN